MSRLSRISTSLIFVFAATHAHADAISGFAPEFSVTDLGEVGSMTYQYDGKNISSITTSVGTKYAFEKSPIQVTGAGTKGPWDYNVVSDIVLSSGPYKAYVTTYRDGLMYGAANDIVWETTTPGSSGHPIRDINIHGQIVGENFFSGGAAFSLPGLERHPSDPNLLGDGDRIQHYLPELPPVPGLSRGIALDFAFAIDDFGRILVDATNDAEYNHVYLLTPLALGDPSPVPEPTTLMMCGVLSIAYGLRRCRRRDG